MREFPPSFCLTAVSSSCFCFLRTTHWCLGLFTDTSAQRWHRCMQYKINKWHKANTRLCVHDFFPNRKKSSSFYTYHLSACPSETTEEECGLPTLCCQLSAPLLQYWGHQLYNWAWLWTRTEKKKKKHFVQSEFLTCHILAWPLGQFYKTEVGRKVYFPAD